MEIEFWKFAGTERHWCFNWATSFQTWKSTWSHWGCKTASWSFNWATSFQTWKCHRPNLAPWQYPDGFNWATSFQTWKCQRYLMEEIYVLRRFNWATSFQTWKFVSNVVRIVEFNWKFQLGHVFSDMEMRSKFPGSLRSKEFQLGHVFSDMEISSPFFYWYAGWSYVSIGPRLFRHGNSGIF